MNVRSLTLAFLLAATLPGCGGGPSAQSASTEGRAVAEAFLNDLRSGKVEPAWEGTSSEFKSLMGLDSLKNTIKRNPVIAQPATYVESRVLQRNNLTLSEHLFRPSAASKGAPRTIIVLTSAGPSGWTVEQIKVE